MSAHPFLARLNETDLARPYGYVRKVAAGLVEATGPASALGQLCEIESGEAEQQPFSLAEVVAVDEARVVLVPLGQQQGIRPDAKVIARASRDRARSVALSSEVAATIV